VKGIWLTWIRLEVFGIIRKQVSVDSVPHILFCGVFVREFWRPNLLQKTLETSDGLISLTGLTKVLVAVG
jgi:hypothetical protein